MKVFICHSSEDIKLFNQLRDNLERYYSFNVFAPDRDLQGGVTYHQPLIKSISETDIFLILLTKNFHDAHFTEQEVGIALGNNKIILPLKLDDITPFGYISNIHALTPQSSLNTISTMVQISHEMYNLLFPNVVEKRSYIISKLETANNWGNQNSLSHLIGVDENYTQSQLIKLHQIFNSTHLDGSRHAKRKIKEILDNNTIDMQELVDKI